MYLTDNTSVPLLKWGFKCRAFTCSGKFLLKNMSRHWFPFYQSNIYRLLPCLIFPDTLGASAPEPDATIFINCWCCHWNGQIVSHIHSATFGLRQTRLSAARLKQPLRTWKLPQMMTQFGLCAVPFHNGGHKASCTCKYMCVNEKEERLLSVYLQNVCRLFPCNIICNAAMSGIVSVILLGWPCVVIWLCRGCFFSLVSVFSPVHSWPWGISAFLLLDQSQDVKPADKATRY